MGRFAFGVDLATVVLAAPDRIGQDVVGGGDALELFLGFLAGVQVGVMLFGELAVRFANVIVRSSAADAQSSVEIVSH